MLNFVPWVPTQIVSAQMEISLASGRPFPHSTLAQAVDVSREICEVVN
ncbi:hypothetical protein BRCON_0834 [Candidatus Sumerlaea chitinivorans]|uniref:Uncharacterized protein n=1 Tax=Sumerlaea chitinivorans TaxID=2250252 RepID=A0A2Z4Y336_SUMC1|nr:hypothetical protein BRCON_0834 [Candidatus Sumerlaea chitinivorans]